MGTAQVALVSALPPKGLPHGSPPFIADHHYNAFPGKYLRPAFDGHHMDFVQDDFSPLESPSLVNDYDLLVLNCISWHLQ